MLSAFRRARTPKILAVIAPGFRVISVARSQNADLHENDLGWGK